MGNESLKIYFEALLDRTKTTTNINSQITAIQNNIKKINIDLGIDTKLLTDFKKQFEQFNQQMISQAQKTQKVIEESFLPDGTKVKRTYYDGTKKEFNLIVDESKKATKEITDNFVKANETISKSNDKLAEQMAKGHEKAIIKSRELDKQWQLEQDKSINKSIENAEKEKQTKIQKAQEYDQWWQKSLKDKELSNQKSVESQINKINSQKINLQDGSTIESETRINRIVALMDQEIAKLEQIKQVNRSLSQQELDDLQRRELAWKNYINSQKSREKTQTNLNNTWTPETINRQQRSLNADADNIKTRYESNVNSTELDKVRSQINNLNNLPLNKLDNELANIKLRLKEIQSEASATSRKFLPEMLNSLNKIASWTMAGGLFFSLIQGSQQVIQTIIDVDTRLTELHKVLDKDTNFDQLMNNANVAANNFGQTLNSVLDSILEFAKAGYQASDAMTLAQATLLGSNVMGMDAANVADAMTAALTSYGLAANEATMYVDKLNETDNNYAVTSAGLAISIQKSAETAKTFGVSLDELIGLTTGVGTATRESGAILGNFIKNVLPRLNSDKTQEVLAGIGVQVKDINGELRPAMKIYGDVAAQWDSMTRAQQTYITEALAKITGA